MINARRFISIISSLASKSLNLFVVHFCFIVQYRLFLTRYKLVELGEHDNDGDYMIEHQDVFDYTNVRQLTIQPEPKEFFVTCLEYTASSERSCNAKPEE